MLDEIQISGMFPFMKADFTEEMELVADDLRSVVQDNFLTSGHGEWPALKTGQPRRLIGQTERLYRSIRREFGKDFAMVSVGEGLPYAGIQRHGGTTHPTITIQSKKFFWHMFETTGDEMWKWMALKPEGTKLTVKIPAADYLKLPDGTMKRYAEMLGTYLVEQSTTTIQGEQPS